MFYYSLTEGMYENKYSIEIAHDEEMSEAEFRNICAPIVRDATKKRQNFWDEVLPTIIEELVKQHGFKRVEYSACFQVDEI